MKFQDTAIEMMKHVAGVVRVRPIIRNKILAIRQGRNHDHELVQDDGQAVRVVALSDTRPSLLSFAAINGLPVRNYTDLTPPSPSRPLTKADKAPELAI